MSNHLFTLNNKESTIDSIEIKDKIIFTTPNGSTITFDATEGYHGPTSSLFVSDILEEFLKNSLTVDIENVIKTINSRERIKNIYEERPNFEYMDMNTITNNNYAGILARDLDHFFYIRTGHLQCSDERGLYKYNDNDFNIKFLTEQGYKKVLQAIKDRETLVTLDRDDIIHSAKTMDMFY